LRTAISGFVFLPPILAIKADRAGSMSSRFGVGIGEVLPQMLSGCSRYHATQFNGDCIADQPTYCTHINAIFFANETIGARKRLQHGAFSK
jgi:hypothetical protein